MNTKVITDFIDAINASDVDSILGLISEDHVFIDSQENKTMGLDTLRQAWTGYFVLFPDYKIEINEILKKGSLVCVLGYASGTYKNMKNKENSNYWRIPAAWTAVIKDGKVKQWQVYADNIVVMDIVKRNQ
jgi:ketosteroid isomerase-like protein